MNYEQKLKKLLDRCEFYTGEDGRVMTPRAMFEDQLKELTETPLLYFGKLRAEIDGYAEDTEMEIYLKHGGGASGAYALIEDTIQCLHQGTLFIHDDTSTGIKRLYRTT